MHFSFSFIFFFKFFKTTKTKKKQARISSRNDRKVKKKKKEGKRGGVGRKKVEGNTKQILVHFKFPLYNIRKNDWFTKREKKTKKFDNDIQV